VLPQLLDLLGGQASSITDRHVALHVAHAAHPGDHRGHGRLGEHEAQRRGGHVVNVDAQVVHDRIDAVLHLLLAIAAEVLVAKVALGEGAVGPDAAGEAALVERHAHDHADVVLAHGGEEPLECRLVEDVVDHLHGVRDAALDDPERAVGLVVVDRDAEEADLALLLERLDCVLPVALAEPLVAPHVELLQVERLQPQIVEGALGEAAQVLAREHVLHAAALGRRPGEVLGRDLAGHVHLLGAVAHDLADQPLAVAVAVCGSRVDEVEPQIDRAVESPDRLVVLGALPLNAADAPGSVADLGHLEARLAESAPLHGRVTVLVWMVRRG
jgi:hypothetical protein